MTNAALWLEKQLLRSKAPRNDVLEYIASYPKLRLGKVKESSNRSEGVD